MSKDIHFVIGKAKISDSKSIIFTKPKFYMLYLNS